MKERKKMKKGLYLLSGAQITYKIMIKKIKIKVGRKLNKREEPKKKEEEKRRGMTCSERKKSMHARRGKRK